MKIFLKKLTCRKFLAAASGIVTGVCLIAGGSTAEGTAALIASVLGYLAAEGIIDARAVGKVCDTVKEKTLTGGDGV